MVNFFPTFCTYAAEINVFLKQASNWVFCLDKNHLKTKLNISADVNWCDFGFKNDSTWFWIKVWINESLLKMMKNSFHFILNALFTFRIFKFFCWLFGHVEKMSYITNQYKDNQYNITREISFSKNYAE